MAVTVDPDPLVNAKASIMAPQGREIPPAAGQAVAGFASAWALIAIAQSLRDVLDELKALLEEAQKWR